LAKIFGFEIKRAGKNGGNGNNVLPSVVPPAGDEGATYITASGSRTGHYLDLDGDKAVDSYNLIQKYRAIAQYSEVDNAVEDIVNEAIALDHDNEIVSLHLDNLEDVSDNLKDSMRDEFTQILNMMNFNNYAHDIFRRWYVDGRIVYNLVVDPKNEKGGIKDIRPIDGAKIRKVKEIDTKKDPATGASIVTKQTEFYIYDDKPDSTIKNTQNAIRMSADSVVYVSSGLTDSTSALVLSYLQKALKPVNQLRMMEDSLVIYRLARAPERRIFYIDVGNMAPGRAEGYIKDIMARYRNKLVYDSSTGDVRDDRKHMSLLEDFWLPRKEGGKGTEITTLPGGENLGQIDDILYFKKRLYESLNVPLSRLEQDNAFSLGRTSEITRDELKFQKFIDRLRRRFSKLFLEILETQLILKRIITQQDWNKWHSDITISFSKDNHFAELKDAEILNERINTLQQVEPYIGKYISHEYVMKNILKMDEDEITDMRKQIDIEATGKFFTEIRDSQELSDRVTALSDLENYIGKYVSVEFAMKNILKMSEKEIEDMKNQIEAEKKEMGSNDDDF